MSNKSRVIRVFLSSTFRDFAEERDLLVRKVFPELRRLCRERQVELVEVDLRWGITEAEAQQGKVLPICLGEIDRARPYFMGFIGDRYGWVPEGSQYPAGIVEREPWLKEHQGGKSVTELEMLHGVLNNPAMAGRAFFYFRDSNYSKAQGGDYISEDAASATKLEALKGCIRSSKFPVVEDYADPQALADQVRADLRALIEAEYPADEVPDDLTLARMRHEAYSQARRGLYIGGEQYFAQLDAALSGEAPQPVLISGEAGLGKSALIASWLQGWRAKHPKTSVILHHLNATAEADDPVQLVRRLGEEAALITGRPYEAAKSKDEILDQLPSILADLSGHAERKGLSVLIVLDGLERCGEAFEDLRWFPKYLPPHIQLVASCSEGAAKEQLHNLTLEWATIELEPLSAAQSRDFIERYLKTYRKSLTPAQADRILAHPLSGRPLWLITLLEELRLFGVHEELEARLDTLLSDPPSKAAGEAPTIDDLYEHVLARIEEDIDEDYEVAAFKALWASYDGLARSELLELTGMPPAKWAEIQNALDENLFESGGQITFGNDFIRKAVEDRHLPTDEDKRAAHRWLGEWFEGREVTLDVAQERVHQWREAGDQERLRACLLEIGVCRAFMNTIERHSAIFSAWKVCGVSCRDEVLGIYAKAVDEWGAIAGPMFDHALATQTAQFFAIYDRHSQYRSLTEKLYQLALDSLQLEHGSKNAKTLEAVYNLGFCKHIYGCNDEALAFFRRAQHGFEKVFGAESLKTLGAAESVVQCLSSGKPDKEEKLALLKRISAGYEKILGAEHTDTQRISDELYNLLYTRTLKDYRIELNELDMALGAKHPFTIKRYNRIGLNLQRAGDFVEAEKLLRRALAGHESLFGVNSPLTINVSVNLASLLCKTSQLDEAEVLFRRAWDHRSTLFYSLLAQLFSRFLDLLNEKGDTEGEIELRSSFIGCYSEKLKIGEDHRFSLDNVIALASLLNKLKRRPEALQILSQRAAVSGPAADAVAYNLACYECLEGNTDEAKRLIAEHLKKHPENKEQALADEDFTSIRDFIKTSPNSKKTSYDTAPPEK